MTFYIQSEKTKIKTLKRGDNGFTICKDGFSVTPRAGFQINQQCPESYKKVILECIAGGWLEPVAYVTEAEFIWDEMKK